MVGIRRRSIIELRPIWSFDEMSHMATHCMLISLDMDLGRRSGSLAAQVTAFLLWTIWKSSEKALPWIGDGLPRTHCAGAD